MNIESPRFGSLQIEPGKVIEFPRGLAGFEDNQRFSLFHPEGDAAPKYFILQSLDDAEIAFQITDPARLGFSYEIELNDEETALLKLSDPGEIAVAVIVWRDSEADGQAGQSTLRASLKAPLLINTRERCGLQHVFTKLDCTLPSA